MTKQSFFKKRTNLYLLTVSLIGFSVFFLSQPFSHVQHDNEWIVILLLIGAIALLEHHMIHLPPNGNALSMDSSIYLAIIFTFGVQKALFILFLISILLYALYRRRMSWLKHLFNFAMYTLMISGAYYIFIFSGGEIGLVNLSYLFAYFLALASYFVINTLLMGIYFLLTSPDSLMSVLKGIIKESLSNYMITLASSLILAMLLVSYPIFGLILFTFVIVLLSLVFKKYLSLYEEVSKDKIYIEQILNSLPVGIITVDDTKSDFAVNSSATKLLKLDSAKIKERVNSREEHSINKSFWELLSSKKIIKNVKVPYKTDVNSHILLVSQSELMNQYHQLIGRIFYFIDITEIEELTKRIHQSEKLALLGELSAKAAHEIRNPLTVIHGFLTFMKESFSESENEKFHIPLLLKELDRINAIIEEMLLIAKPGAPILRKACMEDIVEDILLLFHQTLETQEIRFHVHLDRIPLLIDTKQITQVMYNLIRNSIEAIGGKGTISIYSHVQGESYRIYIQDSGSGIPKEIQKTIFEPFITTKDSGTGLGLTIVKRIVENHQGKIELFSSSEKGTTFIITFPIPT